MQDRNEKLLSPLEAAHHLGITTELLFQFTKLNFGKINGFRPLQVNEKSGKTLFKISELDTFDSMLAGVWSDGTDKRPAIPKAIQDHLRAESQNQCARCGSGIGVENAHIRPWAASKSHHYHNLIRICSACHNEHDVQNSLSTDQLQAIKDQLIARTRAHLMERMQPSRNQLRPPRPYHGFVGREKELKTLIDALRSKHSVAVYGPGGIGKSELVLQALSQCGSERSVLWFNMEQYKTVTDILAALRTEFARNDLACSIDDLPRRLDETHACIVFDGIEQGCLDDIDGFEDTINDLFNATSNVQIISTSQITLHRLPFESQLKLGGLEGIACQKLLEKSTGSTICSSTDKLLQFCDGHALTIKIAGVLIDYYGTPVAALDAVQRHGTSSISLPGRKQNTRQTSLELCLLTAYEALDNNSRKVLWALAQAPAGLLTPVIVDGWLDIENVPEAFAALRKWHLLEFLFAEEEISRTRMLSPIRQFAIEQAIKSDPKSFEKTCELFILDLAIMVGVFEQRYDTFDEFPYLLSRYGHELPNLLYALEIAKNYENNNELVKQALMIIQALIQYFFVLRLPEQGAQVMFEASNLALRTGKIDQASGLLTKLVCLAQRTGEEALLEQGVTLANEISNISKDPEVLADIAMSHAMLAMGSGALKEAERWARQAFNGYSSKLWSLKQDASEDEDIQLKCDDLHNGISTALEELGLSLLSQQKYEEAKDAYEHALKHERGSSIALNRGQTLHQLGNCHGNLGNHEVAAHLYFEAALIFQYVGMGEFLSNALGELGYALLEGDVSKILNQLDDSIVNDGLIDLKEDITRVFNPSKPLDHQQCIEKIRKLFGTIILLSFSDCAGKLEGFCVELGNEIVPEFSNQVIGGHRQKDELFPIMMIDTALRLGVFISFCDEEIRIKGDVQKETLDHILRTVCEAHQWAQDTMKAIDWLAIYLTRKLQYREVKPERLREFAMNYRDDVVDYLDLVRD